MNPNTLFITKSRVLLFADEMNTSQSVIEEGTIGLFIETVESIPNSGRRYALVIIKGSVGETFMSNIAPLNAE